MRIGIAGPTFIGLEIPESDEAIVRTSLNSGTIVGELGRQLVALGHEVVVFSCADKNRESSSVHHFDGVTVCIAAWRESGHVQDWMSVERDSLAALMRDHPVDVLNAHWTYEYAEAALSVRPDALVTMRDWAPTVLWHMRSDARTMAYFAVRLAMQANVLRKAKNVSANSDYLARRAGKWLRRELPFVPNGIRPEHMRPEPKPFAPSDAPVLGAMARGFFGRKNVTALVEAFQQFRVTVPDATLRLTGFDSEAGGSGYQWAAERGHLDNIDFVGEISMQDRVPFYDSLDLFVHPALEETFGLVVAEAMGRGIPVIGGEAAGAVPWVLDQGRAGYLVDVTDADAIAQALTTAVSDRARTDKLAAAGLERAGHEFVSTTMAKRYVELYRSL